ncbi:zinc ribbon domain-containing protein [Methanobrevibacter sp.]|uniref:zinc ribbon domain-containing protein n=1 Tax=Methanobrevibacter sp. TaxID=66852 RepID=UPI00388E88F8
MNCPNCNSENSDSAKFCKKCGTPLKKSINHQTMINSINEGKSGADNTTKYIIIALVIIAVVLAGVFLYLGFANHADDNTQSNAMDTNANNKNTSTVQSSQPSTQSSTQATPSKPKSMTIQGGSFSTGSELSDKTYASIYVGKEHAGESVVVQIKYSRDGNSLNNGNMVPITIDSNGYIDIKSADAYKYYPDYAVIKIFDTSNNLLTTQSVSLSPTSGTQTF